MICNGYANWLLFFLSARNRRLSIKALKSVVIYKIVYIKLSIKEEREKAEYINKF